ncbi:MAG TPA: thymidylate synthase [Polyangiaceae bacterium]|nr:thymidylate synthase [Polyangiaceae bacterium]
MDDLLLGVFRRMLRVKDKISPSRGEAREEFGALLELTNPRARLSRTESRQQTLFSCLGELLWYLAKSNELDFINYYVPHYRKESTDDETVRSAYGPRLFNNHGINQIENALTLLRAGHDSRRAAVQLFEAYDTDPRNHESPCTCTLQFVLRKKRLHLLTFMRSNDVFLGLPHDVFAFTMLQEIVASHLSVEPGSYKHAVGSLHLYDEHRKLAKEYIAEKYQPTTDAMPPMPLGDPWPAIRLVLRAERDIRGGQTVNPSQLQLDPYWQDLVRLLQIFGHFSKNKKDQIPPLQKSMHSPIYDTYIQKKLESSPKAREPIAHKQLRLFD